MTTDKDKFQPTVFISYRREDTGAIAARLANDLGKVLGSNLIFYDQESIKTGDYWKERLKDEVGRCSVFFALIGKEWSTLKNKKSGLRRLEEPEDWVRAEIELALKRVESDDLLIAPLLVEGTTTPEIKDLPNSIQGLFDYNIYTLRYAKNQDWEADIKNLLARCEERGLVQESKAWLDELLQAISARFARQMVSSGPRRDGCSEDLYLDTFVRERKLEKSPDSSSPENSDQDQPLEPKLPLETMLEDLRFPLLLVGEGGAGKTTGLLSAAARAAERAKNDSASAIPIYVDLARLTKIEDLADLHQIIAESVPIVADWKELLGLGIMASRRFLFIFDSFNEAPERIQRNCAVIIQRFAEAQGDRHSYLVGSRQVPQVDQLTHSEPKFRVFEILQLDRDQVRDFLQKLGLGSHYEKMPRELSELAGNPFMLRAITQILSADPSRPIPRNRGRLYQRFAEGWMNNEKGKRAHEYSYDRVKEPLLAYLAKHMSAAGQTSLPLEDGLEKKIEVQLEEISQRIQRQGGMPEKWKVKDCLEEIFVEGLLKRAGGRLHFMHQSIQEYFTALHFRRTFPDALVDFTPKLRLDDVQVNQLANAPNHRFVPPLLMMVGLLDDATKIVEALSARNPILAAAAISSAQRVDGPLRAKLERPWLELLDHDDLHHRVVAASCLALASMRSPQTIQRLAALAIIPDYKSGRIWIDALNRLDAGRDCAREIVARLTSCSEEDYGNRRGTHSRVIKELQTEQLVRELFERWRVSSPGSSSRLRYEEMMATVDRPLIIEELQRIEKEANDPAVTADVRLARDEFDSWRPVSAFKINVAGIRQRYEQENREFINRMIAAETSLTNADERELADSLQSDDQALRASAAATAAKRKIPAADLIVQSLLRFDGGWSRIFLVQALVSLLGEDAAPALLVERMRDWLRANVDRNAGASSQIEQRAYHALAEIPGETSLTELRRAVEQENPNVLRIAIDALIQRNYPDLSDRLIEQLRSTNSGVFAEAAVTALARLRSRAGLSLISDLFSITRDDRSEKHPLWGASPAANSWGDLIHKTLAALGADSDIQRLLDDALIGEGLLPRIAALKEISRWFAEPALSQEQRESWQTPERLSRLIELALSDPDQSARLGAADALAVVKSESIKRAFVEGLADAAVERQLASADALIRIGASEAHSQIAEVMLGAAKNTRNRNLRQRAGRVLMAIRGATEPLYQPIELEWQRVDLGEGQLERILKLTEDTLEIIPDDIFLLIWRGEAFQRLGRMDEAADSFQRAADLESRNAVMQMSLAQSFLSIGDVTHAAEAARQAVELAPNDAEAHAIHAWSCYNAGDIDEAVQAANQALDLDPAHFQAGWILLLGRIRQHNLAEARSAFRHLQRVRQILSPDLDPQFVASLKNEFSNLENGNVKASVFIPEIKSLLPSDD